MIISPGRKFVFVHIPKTGGTSLALALEGRAMKDDIMLGDTPKAKRRRRRVRDAKTRGRLWKHSTLGDIEGLLTREEIGGLMAVTLVRNPWDRMVSYYHWLKAQSFEHEAVHKARTLSFSEFVHDAEVGQAFRDTPYASYMRGGDGVEHAALYIRLEHFEADAEPLWQHLGFRLELPRENTSEREADYRGYYSEADTRRVGEICREDAARFNYSFEDWAG